VTSRSDTSKERQVKGRKKKTKKEAPTQHHSVPVDNNNSIHHTSSIHSNEGVKRGILKAPVPQSADVVLSNPYLHEEVEI
jgi:hypothetical protein